MATQTRFNPNMPNVARHFNGKSVTVVTVDAGVNLTDEFGANGAVQGIIRTITQMATPIVMSSLRDSASIFDIYFEGDFTVGSDWGTTGDLTFAEYLQESVVALGTSAFVRDAAFETVVAGVETLSAGLDLTGATVVFDVLVNVDGENAKDGYAGLVGETDTI